MLFILRRHRLQPHYSTNQHIRDRLPKHDSWASPRTRSAIPSCKASVPTNIPSSSLVVLTVSGESYMGKI